MNLTEFLDIVLEEGIADNNDIKAVKEGNMNRLKTLAYLYIVKHKEDVEKMEKIASFGKKIANFRWKKYSSILKSLENFKPIATPKMDLISERNIFEDAVEE